MTTAEKIQDSYCRFYVSQHYEAWDERIFEKYDPEHFIQMWRELDPDVVVATARTHNGYWFCDVGLGGSHPKLRGTDQLANLVEYAKSKDKPVIAYISTIFDKALYDIHPEWRQVNLDGSALYGDERSWGKVVCPNSPYREFLVDMIGRLIDAYEIDGLYFDMIAFEGKYCYCNSCKKLFYERYGSALPEEEDWDNPTFRNFVRFRNETNHSFVRDICRAVKDKGERLSTVVQYLILQGPGISGQTLAIAGESDYLYNDIYFGQGYLQMSVRTRLLYSVSKYRPEIGIMTRPGSHNDAPNMKTLDHLRAESFTAIANGASIMLFDIMFSDGTLQDAMWKRNGQIFQEIRNREPWLGGDPIPVVGVFYSENTRIWYGRSERQKKYETAFFGACRALLEEHTPFSIVTDLQIPDLHNYQVLLLPNAVCLSEAEAEAIRTYVRQGGGLVCTGKPSLWTEEGTPMADFRLADVLGASYAGETGAYSRVFGKFDTNSPLTRRLPEDGYVCNWGSVAKLNLRGAESLGNLVFPNTEPTGTRFVNIMANPPAVPTSWPAGVINRFGEGSVIFFPGSIDRDFLTLSFPELRYLLADSIQMVSKKTLKIRLEAPISVEITAFKKGSELILHLINFQPDTGRNSQLSFARSRHLIQEILPVYDLKLHVTVSRPVREVKLQPEGLQLEHTVDGDELSVAVPKITCHSMVVIQLE